MIIAAIAGALAKVAGNVAGPAIQTWIKGKADEALANQKIKMAKLEGRIQVEVAKANAKAQAVANRETYDLTALRMQATSWKDEFLIVLVFAPNILSYVAVFFPEYGPRLAAMVEVMGGLSLMQESMQVGIVSGVFGLRWMDLKSRIGAR